MSEEIMTEMMGITDYIQTTRDRCITLRRITDVKKHNPEFIHRLNKIEDLYREMDVREMRRKSLIYQWDLKWRIDQVLEWKSLGNLISESERADTIIEMINWSTQDLIWLDWWLYVLPSLDELKDEIIKRMNQKVRVYWSNTPIFNDEVFNKKLKDYYDDSLTKIVNVMNVTQDRYPWEINFLREYKWKWKYYEEPDKTAKTSLIEDIFNSIKADKSLVLNSFWLNTKEKVVDYFALKAGKIDMNRWQTLYSLLVRKESDIIGRWMWIFHNIYYALRYWLPSMLLWMWWILAWLTQMTWQLIETRALISSTWLWLEAEAINKRFKLLDIESTLGFEVSWLESTDNAASGFVSRLYQENLPQLANKIKEGKLWQYDIINQIFSDKNLKRTTLTLDAINQVVNNPLAAFDAPMDHSRRIAATASTMEKMWIKSYEEFVILQNKFWDDFSIRFMSEARDKYNDVWWWVSSKDSLYKANKLTFHNAYWQEWWFSRMLFQMWDSWVWFLGNWGINKVLARVEDAWQIFTWINKLLKWDTKHAMNNFSDVYRSFAHQIRLLSSITAIWLKLEQYNKDVDSRANIKDFVKSMHNTLVWFDITTWVLKDNYKIAKALNFWTEDTVWFVTSKAISRYFRTLWLIDVWAEIFKYHDYLPEWEWNRRYKAIDNVLHNFSAVYARNSWLEFTEDINNSYSNSIWISMFGIWDFTEYEQLEEEFRWQRSAAWYKDKWFIKTLINSFNIREWTALWENRALLDIMKNVRYDENVRKLESNWIWDLENNYNIKRILWESWTVINEDQRKTILELDKIIWYAWAWEVAKDWWKKTETWVNPSYFWKLDKIKSDVLRSLVNSEWLNVDESFSTGKWKEIDFRRYMDKKWVDMTWDMSDKSYKHFLFLSHESWISTPEVLNYLYESDLKQRKSDYANNNKKPDPYKLWEKIDLQLQRESLLKYKNLLNNDAWMIWIVLWAEVRTNHKKVFNAYDSLSLKEKDNLITKIEKEWEIYKIMTDDVKAWKNAAKYYRNKVAEATRWVPDSETWDLVLKNVFKAMQNSSMSIKDKLTMWTAMVYHMKDTSFNRLRDDKKFMDTIYPYNRAVVNLAYTLDYHGYDIDSKTLANQFSLSAYWNKTNKSWKRKWSSYYKPKYSNWKSSSYGWGGRPNFSKMTEPLKDFVNSNMDLLDKDPIGYINKVGASVTWSLFSINPFKFWPMKEYSKFILQKAIDDINKKDWWIREAWVSRSQKEERLEARQYRFNKNKAPKIDEISYTPKVKYWKARTNLMSDLPLNYKE